MGSLKKFDGSSWINSNLRKLTTDTDTFATFPAIIYAEGTNATVGLKGNTVQTGTPTPDNPVMPQGTGERTGNLFDINATPTKYSQSTTVTVDGRTLTISGAWYIYYEIDVAPNTDYYVDWTIDYAEIQGRGTIAILTTSGQTIKQQDLRPFSFNSGENQRIRLCIYSGNNEPTTVILSNIMFNSGSTPLPYEPYGYKIPISSANTTTPVYLGEVETTRRIKKLVFDGTENVSYNSKNDTRERWVVTIPTPNGTTTPENVICTHFNTVDSTTKPLAEGGICMRSTGIDAVVGGLYTDIGITAPSDSTTIVNAVKAYLQQQYAAGTPVTVWYVLAEPETAVVNEPLMRIGDYADTVRGISIPVTAGGDTLSVGTTIQPSEVTANYYGWHTITVHERESGQWD